MRRSTGTGTGAGTAPGDATDTGTVRVMAADTAAAVADRLRDPAHVAELTGSRMAALPADLMLPGWQPASLTLGHPGMALLHSRRARDDDAWNEVVHGHLSAAVTAAARAGAASAGDLFLAARLHADVAGGYARLLTRSADVLASFATAHAARLEQRIAEADFGLSYMDYDVLAGLAGQGRVLLLAAEHGHAPGAEALRRVLGCLVALTHPVRVGGATVPGWWCAPDRYVVPRDRTTFPQGDLNVGAAHGICGPLALLSLAALAGYGVPGTLSAVRHITDWVLAKERADEWGGYWPGRVSFEEETGVAPGPAPAKPGAGWCYGSSGVALALDHAGRALGDPTVRARALAAMRAACRRPLDDGAGLDLGFCHGRAGTLHAAVRMAVATEDAELWDAATRTARDVAAAYDPRLPFGYRQAVRTEAGTTFVDSPGLVDGATGIALALLGYADACGAGPGETGGAAEAGSWDAAFLVA
ncbi:lanthionine synthetase C family protein [Streptomyces sp. NPDC001948]